MDVDFVEIIDKIYDLKYRIIMQLENSLEDHKFNGSFL